jgi:hypothetical protein
MIWPMTALKPISARDFYGGVWERALLALPSERN